MGEREEGQLGTRSLALLAVAVATASCAAAREHKLEGRTMGTTYHVTVLGRVGVEGLQAMIDRRHEQVNDSLSTYRQESEINRFTRLARAGEEFPACRDFLEVMRTAARVPHSRAGRGTARCGPWCTCGDSGRCPRPMWLMCIGLVVGIASNSFAEWGSKELETEKIAVNFSKEVVRGGYKIVTTEELKSWIDQKKNMLIVDTMPYEDSYKKQHVPGAAQFEFPKEEVTSLDGKTKAAYEKLLGPDKDRLIVIYCGFTKCGRSHNGAMWAVKLGYKNVYRYPGGNKAWMEADYPTEKVN